MRTHARRLASITAYGTPAPKGSLRHVGHGVLINSSIRAKPWAEAVKWATIETFGENPPPSITGPLAVEIDFYVHKPKNKSKFPITRSSGDVDKLARNVLDALVDSGLIKDDSQIVSLTTTKTYAGNEGMPVPGVYIQLWSIDE